MKMRNNTPNSVDDEDTDPINPSPPLRRNVILPDHLSTPRVKPGDSSRNQVTDQMEEISGRKPNDHAGWKAFPGKQGRHHHRQRKPYPKRHAVGPTGVARRQRQVWINDIGSCAKEANNQNLAGRNPPFPSRAPVHPFDQTGCNNGEQRVCDRIHPSIYKLAGGPKR